MTICLLQSNLQAFADSETGVIRIQRHHIEGARAMAKTILFKVQNGSLTIEGPDEGGFQDNFKGLMSRSAYFQCFLAALALVWSLIDIVRTWIIKLYWNSEAQKDFYSTDDSQSEGQDLSQLLT